MGAWFGAETALTEEVVNILPDVTALSESTSPVASEFSVPSRTPSIVSVHSGYSTVSPMSHKFILTLEETYGPEWRGWLR